MLQKQAKYNNNVPKWPVGGVETTTVVITYIPLLTMHQVLRIQTVQRQLLRNIVYVTNL